MSGSVALARHLKLETVGVEPFLTVDGQGKPTYDTKVDIQARVLRQDKMITAANGSEIKTVLALWVPLGEPAQPDEQDRITFASKTFIVMEVKQVKDRDAVVVHRRVRCRREKG